MNVLVYVSAIRLCLLSHAAHQSHGGDGAVSQRRLLYFKIHATQRGAAAAAGIQFENTGDFRAEALIRLAVYTFTQMY